MRKTTKKALAALGFAPSLSSAREFSDQMDRRGRYHEARVSNYGGHLSVDVIPEVVTLQGDVTCWGDGSCDVTLTVNVQPWFDALLNTRVARRAAAIVNTIIDLSDELLTTSRAPAVETDVAR